MKINKDEFRIGGLENWKGYGILVKLSDDKFNGNHPNNIVEGYNCEGKYPEKMPREGLPFFIVGYRWLKTSTVTEIVSKTKKEIIFKTLNSTYKLKIIKK